MILIKEIFNYDRKRSFKKSGKPIEIDGKAYFIQSDIEHLRKLMDSFGKDED